MNSAGAEKIYLNPEQKAEFNCSKKFYLVILGLHLLPSVSHLLKLLSQFKSVYL